MGFASAVSMTRGLGENSPLGLRTSKSIPTWIDVYCTTYPADKLWMAANEFAHAMRGDPRYRLPAVAVIASASEAIHLPALSSRPLDCVDARRTSQ
jgi:hypothetical protein